MLFIVFSVCFSKGNLFFSLWRVKRVTVEESWLSVQTHQKKKTLQMLSDITEDPTNFVWREDFMQPQVLHSARQRTHTCSRNEQMATTGQRGLDNTAKNVIRMMFHIDNCQDKCQIIFCFQCKVWCLFLSESSRKQTVHHVWNHGLCAPVCWTRWLFVVWCKENRLQSHFVPYTYFTLYFLGNLSGNEVNGQCVSRYLQIWFHHHTIPLKDAQPYYYCVCVWSKSLTN